MIWFFVGATIGAVLGTILGAVAMERHNYDRFRREIAADSEERIAKFREDILAGIQARIDRARDAWPEFEVQMKKRGRTHHRGRIQRLGGLLRTLNKDLLSFHSSYENSNKTNYLLYVSMYF